MDWTIREWRDPQMLDYLAERLRQTAEAIDQGFCDLYCAGKCVDGVCLFLRAAEALDEKKRSLTK